ncbi:MAG: tetratricopeptide repeat protein [Coriobacteriia bacterium]
MANKSNKRSSVGKPGPKGPMSVNKSQTPAWMRVVVIVVALSFALGGVAIVVAGVSGGTGSSTGVTGDSITATYKPRVEAAQAAMDASPDNPDVVAQVGHAYFEWAVALYEGRQVSASIPLWKSAVSFYDQVLAVRPDDDIILGNKAFALYYAGDSVLAKPALEAFVAAAADNPRLASQVQNAQGYLTQLESAPATTTP